MNVHEVHVFPFKNSPAEHDKQLTEELQVVQGDEQAVQIHPLR